MIKYIKYVLYRVAVIYILASLFCALELGNPVKRNVEQIQKVEQINRRNN